MEKHPWDKKEALNYKFTQIKTKSASNCSSDFKRLCGEAIIETWGSGIRINIDLVLRNIHFFSQQYFNCSRARPHGNLVT